MPKAEPEATGKALMERNTKADQVSMCRCVFERMYISTKQHLFGPPGFTLLAGHAPPIGASEYSRVNKVLQLTVVPDARYSGVGSTQL